MSALLTLCFISGIKGWSLTEEYAGNNFFNKFDFYTGNDPTHGYVNYVNYNTAVNDGLIRVDSNSSVYFGCDHTNIANGRGRDSIKLTSKIVYNYGLFILSLKHMPVGCGTWPAYWFVGPNWPNSGEIDIIEGVDNQNHDATTLHTSNGCNFKNVPKNFTGYWGTGSNGQPATNCYINAPGQYSNQGCSIQSSSTTSYGNGFNGKGGGVYATQWTSSGIFVWFWNTEDVPLNVYSNSPNSTLWGTPAAAFPFGSWCSSSHFKEQKIVFDLTFCGDWDGSVFKRDCPGKGTCQNYVQYNPGAFTSAYWNVEFIKVFQ